MLTSFVGGGAGNGATLLRDSLVAFSGTVAHVNNLWSIGASIYENNLRVLR